MLVQRVLALVGVLAQRLLAHVCDELAFLWLPFAVGNKRAHVAPRRRMVGKRLVHH